MTPLKPLPPLNLLPPLESFETALRPEERRLLKKLSSPLRIQEFLNTVPYSTDPIYRCPLTVLRENKAHCFDGALFAAAALRCLGFPPLIVELIPNERDDDHLLTLFQVDGCWGVVAPSNIVGLRFREPVYRSVRELIMSYFEPYFNPLGERTLRGWRGPVNLRAFDRLNWMTSDAGLEKLADGLDRYIIHPVMTEAQIARLTVVDERSVRAGLMGSNAEGLFKVK
jgi:hypothetical protein